MSQSNTTAVEAFAKLLAGADKAGRTSLIKRAEIVSMAKADESAFAPPVLLSTQEAAERHALHVNQTREAILRLGYGSQVHRLGGANSNSTECRDALARELAAEHGHAPGYAQALIRQCVTGRGDGALEDLDVCASGPIPQVDFVWDRLIYEKCLHSFVGPEGSNKTILALKILCDLASEAKHVVLLEYEIDRGAVARIIGELGYDREALRPYLHVKRPLAPFGEEVLWDLLAEHPAPAALVLDSMAEAIMSGGDGDEDKSGDSLKVLGPLSALAQQGTAVIVLGHPGHSDATRERGSSAKGPAVDVRYQVQTAPPVTLDRIGKIKLTCRKDRPAFVGVNSEIWYSIGSGEGDRRLPIEQIEKPGEGGLNAFQSELLNALRDYTDKHPEQSPMLTLGKAIEQAGHTETRKRREWAIQLADDPRYSVKRETVLRGNDQRLDPNWLRAGPPGRLGRTRPMSPTVRTCGCSRRAGVRGYSRRNRGRDAPALRLPWALPVSWVSPLARRFAPALRLPCRCDSPVRCHACSPSAFLEGTQRTGEHGFSFRSDRTPRKMLPRGYRALDGRKLRTAA
jgi:hypothetical protein